METQMTDGLLWSRWMDVRPEWIDYNGHMNMAYYTVLLDHAVDDAYATLGLGADYARERGRTTYTAELHICYLRELHLGDRVRGSFRLLGHDAKRFHCYQELFHQDGWIAATGETLALSIDPSGPKVAPFPADISARLEAVRLAQSALPLPERAGRSIGIKPRH
jgi:acyl-CoA thioester hydrolase